MNVNLLTIDNILAGPISLTPAAPRPDAGGKDKIAPVEDDRPPKANSFQTRGTDNVLTDTGKAVSDKPSQEFRQVLRDKTTSEAPAKAQNGTESQEQSTVSNPVRPKDIVQTWLAESSSVPVLQSRDGAAARVEPRAGCRLAQLIAGIEAEKLAPPTGHAAKSAEIKLLHTTDRGQLGIRTVLPEKSNGQNGLKTVSPDASRIMPAAKGQPGMDAKTDKTSKPNETIVDTEALTNKGNVKTLMPKASADAGSKMTAAEKKATSEDASVAVDASRLPARNAKKELMPDTSLGGGSKTVAASEKTASVNAGMPSAQAIPAEKQPQPVASDPGKRWLSAEANARANAPQALSKSSDPDAQESMQRGNDISNARSFQKLNVTDVQVSADQSKDRGRSAADNNPRQSFEQMLPHNGPQIPIAQQSANSAANARTANLPGQTSPGDVPADIGKQILESIHSRLPQQGADRRITIHLNPPELGKVFIKFQEQNGELTGFLEVSKAQTRLEIEHALPQIIRNLADCGIQIRRLDVALSDQGRSEQDSLGGQSLQNSGPYEQGSADQETRGNGPYLGETNEWAPNNKSYQNVSELQEALITDGSINMLI